MPLRAEIIDRLVARSIVESEEMEFDTRRVCHVLLQDFAEYFEVCKNPEYNKRFFVLYDDGKNRNPRITGLIKFADLSGKYFHRL